MVFLCSLNRGYGPDICFKDQDCIHYKHVLLHKMHISVPLIGLSMAHIAE